MDSQRQKEKASFCLVASFFFPPCCLRGNVFPLFSFSSPWFPLDELGGLDCEIITQPGVGGIV